MATKKKPDALSIADTGIDTSIEMLMTIFKDLTDGVQAQLDAETEEQKAGAALATKNAMEGALAHRDQLVEYRNAIEERELRIRRTVAVAEGLARRYKSFVKNLDSSIYQYMAEQGIDRIEGDIHRFAIHKQPDELQITDESALPEKYIQYESWIYTMRGCKKLVDELLQIPTLADYSMDSGRLEALQFAIDVASANPLPYKVRKDLLIEDLKNGIEVPGAFIISNRTRLSVK